MFMTDKKPSSPYCIFLINLSHHHWEFNIINWGQTLDTANIYILLRKMKFYKQRIMLNYQNIPGSYNDTKCIAKYPYSPLYAKRFVNEFKAIDVINYTDKIKHSELLIYDEFQFVAALFSQTVYTEFQLYFPII